MSKFTGRQYNDFPLMWLDIGRFFGGNFHPKGEWGICLSTYQGSWTISETYRFKKDLLPVWQQLKNHLKNYNTAIERDKLTTGQVASCIRHKCKEIEKEQNNVKHSRKSH